MIYKVRALDDGFIALMPRPRGGAGLADELAGLRGQGVGVLVSLLQDWEISALDLHREARAAGAAGIEFIAYPVEDRGVPASRSSFRGLLQRLLRCARTTGVVAHCWGGIGRSGLVAAGVLTVLGATPREAFRTVSEARGEVVPETPAQGEWLERNCAYLVLGKE